MLVQSEFMFSSAWLSLLMEESYMAAKAWCGAVTNGAARGFFVWSVFSWW